MLNSTSKFWDVYERMCEGSDLISGKTTHVCSTMTMRQPMLPSWLDGFWPITKWLWCHILPTRPTLHPATFSYFQNWKWSLRGEDFRRWRKFKQRRRPSWTRYEKITSRNASKTGSDAGIVVKPQNGTTLKVMPGPNVQGKPFCVLSHQSGNLLTTPRNFYRPTDFKTRGGIFRQQRISCINRNKKCIWIFKFYKKMSMLKERRSVLQLETRLTVFDGWLTVHLGLISNLMH